MQGSSSSWFDTLRRDRGLFALVGALAILISMLQPVAAARNAEFAGLGILCVSDHSSSRPGDYQKQGPDCPLCPTGHLCASPASLATPAEIPTLGFFLPAISQQLRPRQSQLPGFRSEASPPSIRAPPFSA
ncbi:hypothetical protein [Chelativorans sp. J32]|uniref:hypothetical protein n=1 Tax=Chelativorans sp. J32 TaxID=935840 RepID=UPI0004B61DBD|nr:hypothetical protein [Chelativorans sp. J32]